MDVLIHLFVGLHTIIGRTPDESINLFRDVCPHGVHHVLIPSSHGGRRPPHEPHDRALGDSEDEQNRRGRVARVAQTPVPDLRLCQKGLPL